MRLALTIAVLIAILAPLQARAHDQARYLGNEGVMVTRGDTKILFDAFYAESFDGTYTLVPASVELTLMQGHRPYDGIDAIFISHIHPDHFNSRKTIAYMRTYPNVQLYAGMDVVGAIRAADASSDPLMKRVVPVHVPPGAGPARFSVGGIEVEAYSIPHSGGGPIPHFAFRVTLDKATTVMHLGDSDADERHFAPYQQHLDQKTTHAAFAPVWMLESESGKRVIQQRIRPKTVIGIHVPDKTRSRPQEARKELGADIFTKPGETRQIGEQP